MTPHAVYATNRAVYVQWDPRGPFVVLHDDGSVTEQWRPPGADAVALRSNHLLIDLPIDQEV